MVVNKMIRQRKEFVCKDCGKRALKWSGFCPECNHVNTMEDHILIPTTSKPKATLSQRGLARRAKNSERSIARRMQEIDGADPIYKNVTSSTGRVGHITGMQIDAISKNYVIENKNRTMPMWLNKAWIQILQRAIDFNKHPLLHIEPSNIIKEFPINGVKRRTDNMAIITQDRHEDLIRAERLFLEIQAISQSSDSNVVKVRKIAGLVS